MFEIFMVAMWLGLVFNAAPGAVFSESLRRGIRGGFRPAFAVQVGSLVGDAVWAVLGLAGVGALFAVPALRVPLTVTGCLLLAWLGAAGLRDALAGKVPDPTAEPHDKQDCKAMAVGAGMSLANPWNVVYWSGAAGGVGAVLGSGGTTELGVFFAGFMASSMLWCMISAGLIVVLRRAMPPLAVRALEACCGVSLLVFAILQLYRLM
ncbi:LysE family translocator [Streptomyces sp. NBC_01142]|uniref:LysE family transporter n=1 Tax=Streptomyces sp. NBC_01142 TaxID=2975865 RepID=UPI0022586A94|nr:LysE family transporter [Streptomyces sp. NBC_01142]MCX4825985.1 LysE family translocator [Streptomyces sp. NBC_01142]